MTTYWLHWRKRRIDALAVSIPPAATGQIVRAGTAVTSELPAMAVAVWPAAAVVAFLAAVVPGIRTYCECGETASCPGRMVEGPPRRSHG